MSVQIHCENLKLGYENCVVLSDLTLDIPKGDYLCIVGENGSGKSTLVKAILGLIQPREGKITYDGLAPNEIGYLPQQSAAQRDFPASVQEVVLSGCLNRRGLRPYYSREEKQRAEEAMRQMDILHLKKACYRELSGGQQQRVLLARALLATSRVLLLDEPMTGLDPVAAHDLYELIEKLNREQQITIIMVTHDIHCALHEAKSILHIGQEGVRFAGSREAYEHSDAGRRFAGGHDHV